MSSANLKEVRKGEVGGDVGLATMTFPSSSDSVNWTSKLEVLLIVSMELANEICEQAEEGRGKIEAPGRECDSVLVWNWG